MAETATKTTTPRRRTPTKPAATKAPTKAAATEQAPEETTTKITFELALTGETKRYATFDLAADKDGHATGCVGKVYAPLGTETVKVLLAGPAEVVNPE